MSELSYEDYCMAIEYYPKIPGGIVKCSNTFSVNPHNNNLSLTYLIGADLKYDRRKCVDAKYCRLPIETITPSISNGIIKNYNIIFCYPESEEEYKHTEPFELKEPDYQGVQPTTIYLYLMYGAEFQITQIPVIEYNSRKYYLVINPIPIRNYVNEDTFTIPTRSYIVDVKLVSVSIPTKELAEAANKRPN